MGWIILTIVVMVVLIYFLSQSNCVDGGAHQWGRWSEWGITYQQRKCLKCGMSETKSC